MPKTVPSIVVLNSSQDTIDLLKVVLEEQGYAVASAHVSSLKSGEIDVIEFVSKHSPDAIVYDIALPYEENWKFLRLLQSSDAFKDVQWVITTTHKKRLQELVSDCGEVYEVVGKPYDLGQIVGAIKNALDQTKP
jgi:CheY-like chemotaxis protein